MGIPDVPPPHHFLVEWYEAGMLSTPLADTAARLTEGAAVECAHGYPVSVVLTVAAPGDEMVFGVFCAETADVVRRVCRDAGCPADRITEGVHTYIVEGTDSD